MENNFFGVTPNEPDFDPTDITTANPDSIVSKTRSDHLEETYKDDNAGATLHPNGVTGHPQHSKDTNAPEIEEMDLPDTEMGTCNGVEVAQGRISAGKSPEGLETKDLSPKDEQAVDTWAQEQEKFFEAEYSSGEREAKNQEFPVQINDESVSGANDTESQGMKSSNKKMTKSKQNSKFGSMSKSKQIQGKGKFTQKSGENGLDNFRQVDDNLPKKQTKKQLKNKHTELVNIMQSMSTFNWLDTYGTNQKNHPMKSFNFNSFWFMNCTNYFPRTAFAHKNNKEFIHQRMHKLKSFLPDIPQRLTKADLQSEVIQKQNLNEFESLLLNSFSKATKYSLDSYKSNSYVEKILSFRTVNPVHQSDYTAADDEWLMETRRCIYDNYVSLQEQNFLKTGDYDFFNNPGLLSKVDLQDVITFYEKDLYELLTDNEKRLGELEKKTMESLGKEDIIHKTSYDAYDSLVDLRIRFAEEDAFINMLEKKQNDEKESVAESVAKSVEPHATKGKGLAGKGGKSASYISVKTKPKVNMEESICHICNDEDYTEDDLIVFCSKCNISVHQKCYGLPILPNGDWVCDLCLTFGENGKYLRCPFCDKRGGAMKPTITRADTKLFESINPNFHKFTQSYAYPEILKTLPKAKSFVIQPKKDDDEDMNDEEKAEDLYYDFQLQDDNFTEEELENEPRFPNIWVHITCALFVPELYFSDDVTMSGVLGLDNVSKERFKYDCSVCGKKKGGAIVNCEKLSCKRAFHPECARRGKQFLDIRENNNNQFVYHIYCEKHIPLKLKRTIEGIENKMREDLYRFFKAVERQHTAYLTEMKQKGIEPGPAQTILKEQEAKSMHLKKKKALSIKEEGNYFLKLIEKYIELYRSMPFSISVQHMTSEEYPDQYKLTDITFPRKIAKNDKRLTPEDEIWSVMPYKNLTPEQKYLKYKKLNTQTKKKLAIKGTKSKAGLLKTDALKQKNLSARELKALKKAAAKANKEEEYDEVEDPNVLYCVCQKPYKGELMMECESCGTWYHPKCMGLTIKNENELQSLNWRCSKCKGQDDNNDDKAGGDKLLRKRMNNTQTGKDKKYIPRKKTKSK